MEKHDIIVYIIVGSILILQIKAFLSNYLKIKTYKETMRKSKDFEMVEVYVDENEIDQVDVEALVLQVDTPEEKSNEVELKSSEIGNIDRASRKPLIPDEDSLGVYSEEELPADQNDWSLGNWLNDKVNSLFEGSLSSRPEDKEES